MDQQDPPILDMTATGEFTTPAGAPHVLSPAAERRLNQAARALLAITVLTFVIGLIASLALLAYVAVILAAAGGVWRIATAVTRRGSPGPN